jgi:hypothetical protein
MPIRRGANDERIRGRLPGDHGLPDPMITFAGLDALN